MEWAESHACQVVVAHQAVDQSAVDRTPVTHMLQDVEGIVYGRQGQLHTNLASLLVDDDPLTRLHLQALLALL